jgi:CPA1 family monovalent cation:H+ antiporter
VNDTAEIVRRIPICAELTDEEVRWIADLATEFDVPAGFVLIEHGQPGSGMFIVTDGTISIELPRGPIERGPGEFVGELALLADGFARVARVRAKTRVKGLAISRMAFFELLEREPRVAVKMLPVLAMRLAQAETI